jgi:hypothetical protein
MKNFTRFTIILSLVVSFIFLTTGNVSAQLNSESHNEYEKNYEFGVRFLPTISNFQMQTSEYNQVSGEVMLGYGGGLFLSYNPFKHMGFQVELNYTSISRKYSISNISRIVNLQYLSIPLLLSFNTNKNRAINFNVVFGPQIGINTGSTIYTSGNDPLYTAIPIVSIKKGDLGLAYGLGFDFGLNDLKTIRLGFGFRGVLGLFNVSNNIELPGVNSFYIIKNSPVHTYTGYVGFSILI